MRGYFENWCFRQIVLVLSPGTTNKQVSTYQSALILPFFQQILGIIQLRKAIMRNEQI